MQSRLFSRFLLWRLSSLAKEPHEGGRSPGHSEMPVIPWMLSYYVMQCSSCIICIFGGFFFMVFLRIKARVRRSCPGFGVARPSPSCKGTCCPSEHKSFIHCSGAVTAVYFIRNSVVLPVLIHLHTESHH